MEVKKHRTVPELLTELNKLYDKEEAMIKEMRRLRILYQQLQDDKEMMQNMVMYASNRTHRQNQYKH